MSGGEGARWRERLSPGGREVRTGNIMHEGVERKIRDMLREKGDKARQVYLYSIFQHKA